MALEVLKDLKRKNEGHKPDKKDPLANALSNLEFIIGVMVIPPIRVSLMENPKKVTVLTGPDPKHQIEAEGTRPASIYHLGASGPFITGFSGFYLRKIDEPTFRGTLLTKESLQAMWGQNRGRNSIEHFGKMPRKEIVERFEQTVKSR